MYSQMRIIFLKERIAFLRILYYEIDFIILLYFNVVDFCALEELRIQ